MIFQNLETIRQKINLACSRSGQLSENIHLIAVTKKVPAGPMIEASRYNITDFGESKVQEAQTKFQEIHTAHPHLKWHLIGHLQSNKVNRAVELFDLIQSVDSIKLIERIDRNAFELKKIQNCLIELKVSQEPAKTGMDETELDAFFEYTESLKNINIQGLMCIAPYFQDLNQTRPYFKKARKIFEKYFILKNKIKNPILSMGMSHDFETAIEEGSTMVRVGTAIFGDRI